MTLRIPVGNKTFVIDECLPSLRRYFIGIKSNRPISKGTMGIILDSTPRLCNLTHPLVDAAIPPGFSSPPQNIPRAADAADSFPPVDAVAAHLFRRLSNTPEDYVAICKSLRFERWHETTTVWMEESFTVQAGNRLCR
uniref:Uncharacterized protein n=1 Tax=Oryza punctata TaxID=4537 RepID=A0A0E0JXH7_ORYPU